MTLKLYNTLTRQKEEFVPINPGKVGMYACGPTVYDYIHIGNILAYTVSDTLRRVLEYNGYEVRLIRNITDVGHMTNDDTAQGDTGEDKMEKRARATNQTPWELAEFFETYFHATENRMNILPAHFYPQATKHVPQMIAIIEKLVANGYAYEVNGNVFFDITNFPTYGKLSGNSIDKLKIGARLEEHPDKKNPWDFALWLKAPENHIMKWPSPWSVGYPGWHIECTAMSTEYLSETFDIHTGGEDNIFPHHEAEIAQTESATGKPFVKYWLHNRLLLIDGKKMSKSKGNFYKLEDITDRGFLPVDLRLLILSSHYGSQMNFSWEALEQARKNRIRIEGFLQRVHAHEPKGDEKNSTVPKILNNLKTKFDRAINDDINIPLALSILYENITLLNRELDGGSVTQEDKIKTLALWQKLNHVLGLVLEESKAEEEIPQEILDLLTKRQQAREAKDFSLSDNLRDEIVTHGYSLEDTKDRQIVKKIWLK